MEADKVQRGYEKRSKRCGRGGEKEAIVNDILGGDKERRRGYMANSETAAEVKQVIGR